MALHSPNSLSLKAESSKLFKIPSKDFFLFCNSSLSTPDKLEDFKSYFIDDINGSVKNENLFQRRIIGLTSYFRSAQEQLMPRYDKITDFRVIEIPMSDYQFKIYEAARVKERKTEKPMKGPQTVGGLYKESNSTYRIFSRLYCNFVMPDRPVPIREKENLI